MQFHHHGYVSEDPRVQPAAGVGLDRPDELPGEVDVLIVGTGPAGMIAAAQLSQFPGVTTRIVERRAGRLELGHADGVSVRSVETFQAFGFAGRIVEEAYRITQTSFWKPDPRRPENIVRATRTEDDPNGLSEFPHITVNQARVADYFAEAMANGPARMRPDYGLEFVDLKIGDEGTHPVAVTLRRTADPSDERVVRAKFMIGADGARSAVRESIGRRLAGDQAMHAWGVMDALVVTDFPDLRTKCAIQSHDGGNILWIPREGGYLTRIYVDLGEVATDDGGAVRETPLETVIEHAKRIFRPFSFEVRDVPWHSVYEVGHRLTDRFDDVPASEVGSRTPRVFIAGDACHTHSAKAGQGMNVSMQDGWNIGWKLGYVLQGRSPRSLLDTYSAERQQIAKDLIDFDKRWSTLMAARPEELASPTEVEDFYVRTWEFPSGMATEYPVGPLSGGREHQGLASGFPIGKRFKSAAVVRVCDGNPLQLGHLARADGRWRIYVFADAAGAGAGGGADAGDAAADSGAGDAGAVGGSALGRFAQWLATSPESPVVAYTPPGADLDAMFDVVVIYQQDHHGVEITQVPEVFKPRSGPFRVPNWEKAFAADPRDDIFWARGVDRRGAVVVVRPDQYVAHVLPLDATRELAEFFAPIMLPAGSR